MNNRIGLVFLLIELQLRTEIDGVGEVTSYQSALKLPYLQAVIREALRLHPATGLPLGRVVPRGGTVIVGKYLPEGVCDVPHFHQL